MNKWNRLLKCLGIDEDQKEHVISIEYTVRLSGGGQVKKDIDPEAEAMSEVLKQIRLRQKPGCRNGV